MAAAFRVHLELDEVVSEGESQLHVERRLVSAKVPEERIEALVPWSFMVMVMSVAH